MSSILIGIFTFLLILVSVFLVLIILMQKAKSDGGMGAALGGGMAEAAFGADTGNMLTKGTRNAAIAFFVLCFGLYLAHVYQHKSGSAAGGTGLPAIPVSTTEAPAAAPAPAPAAPAPAPAGQPANP